LEESFVGAESRLNPFSIAAAGPPTVLDCRGRSLEEGDEVLLLPKAFLGFRVLKIQPTVDPKLPPGSVLVTLVSLVTFLSQKGQINQEFARIQTKEEAGPMPIGGEKPVEDEAAGE
jgi:hypothetical protein